MQSGSCSLALVAAAPIDTLGVAAMINGGQSSDVSVEYAGGWNWCNEGGECSTGAKRP